MIINILGCMGIGKTTILEETIRRYHGSYVKERFEDNPYWKAAYAGEEPEFLKMQIEFMTQYIKTINDVLSDRDDDDEKLILDQFFYTWPFIMTQNKMGLINDVDKECYLRRWRVLKKAFKDKLVKVKNIILIDKSENIFKKIKERNREAEAGLTFEFINCLNNFFTHPEYLASFVGGPTIVNVENLEKGDIPFEIEKLFENL